MLARDALVGRFDSILSIGICESVANTGPEVVLAVAGDLARLYEYDEAGQIPSIALSRRTRSSSGKFAGKRASIASARSGRSLPALCANDVRNCGSESRKRPAFLRGRRE